MKNNYLIEIISKLESIKSDSIGYFGSLTSGQLKWKPTPEKWSIGQCFDHILISNRQYFGELEGIISGHPIENFWKSLPLLPKFFGGMLLKAVSSDAHKKYKAPKILLPSESDVSPDIIRNFVKQQDDFIQLIRRTDDADHDTTKVTSPVTKFITYSLKDTINILTIHEERHFKQAERVLHSDNFPLMK